MSIRFVKSVEIPAFHRYLVDVEPSLINPYFNFMNKVFSNGFYLSFEKEDNTADIVNDLLSSIECEDFGVHYLTFQEELSLTRDKLKSLMSTLRTISFFESFDVGCEQYAKELETLHGFYLLLWETYKGDIETSGYSIKIFNNIIRADLIRAIELVRSSLDCEKLTECVFFAKISKESGIVLIVENGNV